MIVFSLSLSIYQPNAEDLTEDPRSIRDGEATRFRRLLTEHLNCYITEKVLCVFVGIKPLKCGGNFLEVICLHPSFERERRQNWAVDRHEFKVKKKKKN